jgi:8-oxo-dGTP diphosphatase
MDMMQESTVIKSYVAGFLFDKYYKNVLLISKLKPAWQAGFYNGVGGKIEHGETPFEAMVREFKEEATLSIRDWRQFAKLRGQRYTVYFFTAKYPWDLTDAKAATDEQLIVAPVSKIPELRIIENLKWLVPMAADSTKLLGDIQDQETYGS